MNQKSASVDPARPGDGAGDDDKARREFLVRLTAWEMQSGWKPPSAFEGRGAGTEVMVYLVDTLTLWNVVGCTTEAHAAHLLTLASQCPTSIVQKAPALAGHSLLKAASHRYSLDAPDCQTALTMAGLYLSFTETMMSVARKGSIQGHWIALLYHLENGSHTLRPAYAGKPAGRKLQPAEHMQLIVDVIAGDLQGRSTEVGARIDAAGGLKLPPALAKRAKGTMH